LATGDEALTGAAGEQRNLCVDTQDFEHLFRFRKKLRRNEHESQIDVTRQAPAQLLRPLLQARFVKVSGPMRRNGEFVVHAANLTTAKAIANWFNAEAAKGCREAQRKINSVFCAHPFAASALTRSRSRTATPAQSSWSFF